MAYKKSQLIMIWLLPVIVIGGLFIPVLGYLVLGMMVFFSILSFFRGRYWCWNLCPRGAFLDIVLSRVSANKPVPKIFAKNWFRPIVFIIMIGVVTSRIIKTGGDWMLVGSVFVVTCVITTLMSVIIGIATRHRGWCVVCPMGYLQEKIGKANKADKR